ncbi:hypothetical protein VNO80_07247 [Phaseolus coccineus]|uniref:Copper transport protein n=1 Tax=Phaseolus coccineus TaxID=3886 RepID=A0AAN9NJB5_PHACN
MIGVELDHVNRMNLVGLQKGPWSIHQEIPAFLSLSLFMCMSKMYMPSMPNGTDNNMKSMMQMSFYWGTDAIVLFPRWPDNSVGMYILAIIFVFLLAMAIEVLSNQPLIKPGTSPLLGGLIQAIVHFFRISFVYMVMLAVMSFNGGIFIAAVVGHTLGFFIAKSRALALANREEDKGSSSVRNNV